MAEQMFLLCYQTAPELFRNAGPSCIRGKCPEGEKSCGQAARIRKERDEMLQEKTEEI